MVDILSIIKEEIRSITLKSTYFFNKFFKEGKEYLNIY